jgi:hypothetical protein
LAITMSFRMGNGLPDQGNVPGSIHVPMVYEQLPVEPVHWEYHVMVVDTREMDVSDTAQLNELGAQGWLLVGILNQSTIGSGLHGGDGQMTSDYVSRVLDRERQARSPLVHYYFVRQRSEGDELA